MYHDYKLIGEIVKQTININNQMSRCYMSIIEGFIISNDIVENKDLAVEA